MRACAILVPADSGVSPSRLSVNLRTSVVGEEGAVRAWDCVPAVDMVGPKTEIKTYVVFKVSLEGKMSRY